MCPTLCETQNGPSSSGSHEYYDYHFHEWLLPSIEVSLPSTVESKVAAG